jgi:hypothetical protein
MREILQMKFVHLFAAVLLLCSAQWAAAQDRGYWRAASKTAASITGDVTLSETKVTINYFSFPLAHIQALKPAEVAALFDADADTAPEGALYRLRVSPAQRFLHKNTLCGSEQVEWMATWVSGKTLSIAFFSGDELPVFTFDAISHSTTLCGIYLYSR